MSPFVGDLGAAPAQPWWRCPNTPPCQHPGLLHDIEDPSDPRPVCCADGCSCGRENPKA